MTLHTLPRRLTLAFGLGLPALAAFGTLLFAAGTKDTPPSTPPPKTSHFKVFCLRETRQTEGKVTTDTLTKATFIHDDTRFSADLMVMKTEGEKGDKHEITCTGSPVLDDPENHITGEKVIALSSPRQAEFIGNVKMVSTPKKKSDPKVDNAGNMREKFGSDPSTTTCEHLLYNYSTKRAKATGHVVILQKARTVWADEADYDQNLELVTLTGNVHMKNTGQEELKDLSDAETVTISLQNDWVDMVPKKGKQLVFDFLVQDEDQNTAPASGAKAPPPPTAPPAAETPAPPSEGAGK